VSTLLFPPHEDLPPARTVAGVDEAGLGPLLGPLTIGFSAFRVPAAGLDLWRALVRAVARRPERGREVDPAKESRRLVVADSKVVFERNPRGEARLERTALAFLAARAPSMRPPLDGKELVRTRPGIGSGIEEEPWFPHLPSRLPLFADESALGRSIAALVSAMRASAVELAEIGARLVSVAELNASLARTGNKSRTHWDLCAAVLRLLWDGHAREGLDLVVDRHGGRMRYRALLGEAFPEARVAMLSEDRSRSEYLLVEPGPGPAPARFMRAVFVERAETGSFPAALASCVAKYARETCMRAFNAYFGSLQPDLRPTAGYFQDGQRWLAEAVSAIERSGVASNALVRQR